MSGTSWNSLADVHDPFQDVCDSCVQLARAPLKFHCTCTLSDIRGTQISDGWSRAVLDHHDWRTSSDRLGTGNLSRGCASLNVCLDTVVW